MLVRTIAHGDHGSTSTSMVCLDNAVVAKRWVLRVEDVYVDEETGDAIPAEIVVEVETSIVKSADVTAAVQSISTTASMFRWFSADETMPKPTDAEVRASRPVLASRGWEVKCTEMISGSRHWVATSGEMVASAWTQDLLLRAIEMCSEDCPSVEIYPDGRVRCECEDDDGDEHSPVCPLSRHNPKSCAYAQEIGQV